MSRWLAAWLSLVAAPAWAASWSVPERLGDAPLDVPAGVAVRLLVADPRDVSVREVDGAGVPVKGVADGLLVPAAGAARQLVVDAPAGTVRVARSDGPGEVAAWEAWEVAAARSLRRGEPPPDPPWGGTRLLAEVRLRAAAVEHLPTAWLGVEHDLAGLAPVSGRHDLGPEVAGNAISARGPGLVVVRTRPPAGALTRYEVVVSVDGVARPGVPVASTGAVPLATRVWIPPGEHHVQVDTPGVPCELTLQEARLRPRLLGPAGDPPASGVAAAEWAYLLGDLAGARAGFAAFAEAEGPAGELARARLVGLADEGDVPRALARWRDASPDGRELVVDALLARAGAFPDDEVLAAVLAAADPDLGSLARWLDGLGGVRPRGVGLLSLAAPAVPFGPSPAVLAVREAGLATRWARLEPVAGTPVVARVGDAAPGVARIAVTPEAPALVRLPGRPAGRLPVLRMRAIGPVRGSVDGEPFAQPAAGDHPLALPPGDHAVAVVEGELLLLDAEGVEGGLPRWEWPAATLPAAWDLPDPGVPVALRVDTDADVPLLLAFDDGRVVEARTVGGRADVDAGPHARRVTVLGPAGVAAGLAIRTVREPLAPEIDPAVPDEEAALARLRALSLAIDRGETAARLDRARLLGQLGLLGMARRDLAVLFDSADDALVRRAIALAGEVTPGVPSAPAAGPRSLAAALAWSGAPPPADPSDPVALEALARDTGEPYFDVLASEAWIARGRPVEAWAAASRAGAAGADALAAIEARLRWSPITRADRAAGLVPVAVTPTEGPAGPWRRARDAILASPWPEGESLTLRGDTRDVARVAGTRIEVALFCRDEEGPGRACEVDVRVDGESRVVRVPDGASPTTLAFAAVRGEPEIEVGGPGRGRALVVRLSADGAAVPPGAERLALRATPARAIELVLARPALLRVEVLRGRADVDGVEIDGERVVAIPGEGPGRVRIAGDADLLLASATLTELPPPPAPPRPPPPPARLPATALEPLWARFVLPGSPPRDVPGRAGTLEVALTQRRDVAGTPARAWDATELAVAWMKRGRLAFAHAEAWAAGPGWSAGGEARAGVAWDGGWASAGVEGAGSAVGAASVAGVGRVRQAWALAPRHALRADGSLRAGYWSAAPASAADPEVWTAWGKEHPARLSLGAAWVAKPGRDLTTEVGWRATSNTAPSIDHLAGWAEADLAIGRFALVSPRVGATARFPDAHRARGGIRPEAALGAEAWWWTSRHLRVSVWGEAGWIQRGPEARLGVRLLLPGGRGLHDLPPGSEPFRTLRSPP